MRNQVAAFLEAHPSLVVLLIVLIPLLIAGPTVIAVMRGLPDRRKIAVLNIGGLLFATAYLGALGWAVFGRKDESYYERILRYKGWLIAFAIAMGMLFAAMLYYFGGIESLLRQFGRASSPEYRLVELVYSPGTEPISASGRLVPQKLVNVSSEVSGKVLQVYVKANDLVTEGQPIARMDPASYAARATQAQAEVSRAAAAVKSAVAQREAAVSRMRYLRAELDRREALFQRGFVSRTQAEQVRSDHASAVAELARNDADIEGLRAALANARASLQAAELDLSRTVIRSPVRGTVLNRRIEPGQTVVSAFQAQTLFDIAETLTSMRVEAVVDETEIGRVRVGSPVSFTVDAYPDLRFQGRVLDVLKAPIEEAGVVSYKVPIEVANQDNRLFTGMTAMVEIGREARQPVFRIPAGALEFRPAGAAPANGAAVYRYRGKRLERVPVETVRVPGGGTDIRAPKLASGDRIAIARAGD